MLEKLTDTVEERISETLFPSPVGVIKKVAEIMNENPEKVVFQDLSDYPLPRVQCVTEVESETLDLVIKVTLETDNDVVEIILLDPSTFMKRDPRDKSYCYRVNIFRGKEAEKYSKSTGYNIEVAERNQNIDDGKSVVSDCWTETNLSATRVLEALNSIKSIKLPMIDMDEKTSKGTLRNCVLAQS